MKRIENDFMSEKMFLRDFYGLRRQSGSGDGAFPCTRITFVLFRELSVIRGPYGLGS